MFQIYDNIVAAYRHFGARHFTDYKEFAYNCNKKGNLMDIYADDGNIERALKVLKRYVQKEGILRDVKRKSFYEKPSDARRRKERDARKRRLKAERRKPRFMRD
jgi:small subunit ribosomal protein S21